MITLNRTKTEPVLNINPFLSEDITGLHITDSRPVYLSW